MLPSMPILFTRDSLDAFGNKIEPSTSFFHQNPIEKPAINNEPQSSQPVSGPSTSSATNEKGKADTKNKNPASEEKPKAENALETALVRSYYAKVQSKFSTHMNMSTNKFVQFQNILKSFDPDKETPVDLYRKIEALFGEEHKDLVEEFLLFLRPGQAAQVGRFMDYFMMVQMTSFIDMLQKTFARKPTVLRKILRAITTGINTGSSEDMKNRVLPHLRSHPRLINMFKSLFPDERPPDSYYETGTDFINESFLSDDKGYDVWEFEETSSNKRNLQNKEGLDTMYLNGRVFLQHGRMVRAARVSFPYSKEPYRVHARRLAPHARPSPPHSDDEHASPKRQSKTTPKIPPKKPKKQAKSPVKNAKDVNDNTNKECASPKTVRKPTGAKVKTCNRKDEVKAESKKEKKEKAEAKNTSSCKKDEAKTKAKIKTSSAASIETKVEITASPVDKKPDTKGNWTRDEDKTMLQVLKGEAGSEQVFGKISELLPHRSVTEIKERFFHVMNLLQEMAVVGEVR